MGIKSICREIVQRARGNGYATVTASAIRNSVGGRDVPPVSTAAPSALLDDRAEADEKIIKASLVADEWDGAVALLSRRA